MRPQLSLQFQFIASPTRFTTLTSQLNGLLPHCRSLAQHHVPKMHGILLTLTALCNATRSFAPRLRRPAICVSGTACFTVQIRLGIRPIRCSDQAQQGMSAIRTSCSNPSRRLRLSAFLDSWSLLCCNVLFLLSRDPCGGVRWRYEKGGILWRSVGGITWGRKSRAGRGEGWDSPYDTWQTHVSPISTARLELQSVR